MLTETQWLKRAESLTALTVEQAAEAFSAHCSTVLKLHTPCAHEHDNQQALVEAKIAAFSSMLSDRMKSFTRTLRDKLARQACLEEIQTTFQQEWSHFQLAMTQLDRDLEATHAQEPAQSPSPLFNRELEQSMRMLTNVIEGWSDDESKPARPTRSPSPR